MDIYAKYVAGSQHCLIRRQGQRLLHRVESTRSDLMRRNRPVCFYCLCQLVSYECPSDDVYKRKILLETTRRLCSLRKLPPSTQIACDPSLANYPYIMYTRFAVTMKWCAVEKINNLYCNLNYIVL